VTEERFWAKVAIPQDPEHEDDCWEWQGGRTREGYGSVGIVRDGRRTSTPASRHAFELVTGEPIPAGLFVCHSCDNPPCCNPNHLWLGTPMENVRDAMRKDRIQGGQWLRFIESRFPNR
jgi:hypothetical protein